MRKLLRWKAFVALLTVGSFLPTSCATDFRDSSWGAVLDGVGGIIADSIGAAVPLPDWIAAFVPTPPE